jgi:hypothetical protein
MLTYPNTQDMFLGRGQYNIFPVHYLVVRVDEYHLHGNWRAENVTEFAARYAFGGYMAERLVVYRTDPRILSGTIQVCLS